MNDTPTKSSQYANPRASPHRRPLHVHIAVRFLALLILVGGVMGGLGYTVNRDILERSAHAFSERVGRDMLRELRNIVGPTEMATRLLSQHAVTQATSLEQRLEHLRFMVEALSHSAELTSLYVGYANGDFFLLRRVASASERNDLAAPEETVFLVQSIDHPDGQVRGRFIYLDSALATLGSVERPDYAAAYDPRTRDWYAQAHATHSQIITSPYPFFTTGITGTTVARHAYDADAVVGADIRLGSIARALSGQKATPGTQVVLANASGQIVVDEDGRLSGHGATPLAPLESTGDPVFAQLTPIVRSLDNGTTRNVEVKAAGSRWQVSLSALQLEGSELLILITAIPDVELMADAYALLRHAGLVMLAVVLLAVPIIWVTARTVSRPLRRLAGEVDAIRHFEFAQTIAVDSSVREVDELAQATAMMKRTISRFLHISETIAAENDFDRLLPHLLGEMITAASADAGVLYLVDGDRLLAASSLQSDGGILPDGRMPTNPPISLASIGSPLLQRAVAAKTACAAQLVAADIDALGLASVVEACGASDAIAIPLINRKNLLVGAMILILRRTTDNAQLSFINALCGSLAVSLEAKESMRAQKQLFAALIRLIAGAIDAKSPYTGGHCERVPEIAKSLARAACAQTSGPYADFALDADGWEALHIAAWLHDCGKVTTPEYVVDKATKLETIYDRIHEIRMRFEVLKRDARIACLEAIAAGADATAANARLYEEWAQLDADFAFVAACNEGGEAMSQAHLDRLRAIAAQTWLRTLDDRLGVSHDEARRRARTPAPPLPVREPLLADKPEHRIERDENDMIDGVDALAIAMTPPELRYHRGELYNLSIERGTLTAEERYKINEHSVQSLIMLNRLPFPGHLRNVPEIACGHHEKIDGSGYPRRLRGEQMSVLARVMVIADIFEALTAADRPYKRGKTLAEAIAIMTRMRDEQHIDAELFDLFVDSGVHLDYARRFMRAEQIDEAELSNLARAASATTS